MIHTLFSSNLVLVYYVFLELERQELIFVNQEDSLRKAIFLLNK